MEDYPGEITESDTDSESDDTETSSTQAAPIPMHQHPLEESEDALVTMLLGEIPSSFRERCNHDVVHQIRCMLRKYKSHYSSGCWLSTSPDTMPEIIAGGVTQNGKTMIKAVGIWLGFRLGVGHPDATKVSTVILSTTLKGTQSLCKKLQKAFRGFPPNLRPPIVFAGSAPYSQLEHRNNLRECIARGGCVVVNDTAARVAHALSATSEARGSQFQGPGRWPQVQIFMDEADAFYRNTPENHIKLEHAITDLFQRVRPILRMSVSATLIPVFLHLKEKQQGVDAHSIIYTQPGPDYNGVQDFKPLTNNHGDNIFLKNGDLTKSNGYYNQKLEALYRHAFAARRSLVLNITNPGVATSNNVYEHAAKIQQEHDDVGCIVFVGKGISYWLPAEIEIQGTRQGRF